MPKTAKKKTAKKRGRDPGSTKAMSLDIFEIEAAPPPHRFRGTTPEVEMLKEKIKRTMEYLKPGQAFIVPSEHRVAVRRFLTTEYPDKVMLTAAIPGNDAVIRVYLRKPAQ